MDHYTQSIPRNVLRFALRRALVVDEERAARAYTDPTLAAKWMQAVLWMQQRPGGSIWLLDGNRPPAKWHYEEASNDAHH